MGGWEILQEIIPLRGRTCKLNSCKDSAELNSQVRPSVAINLVCSHTKFHLSRLYRSDLIFHKVPKFGKGGGVKISLIVPKFTKFPVLYISISKSKRIWMKFH